MTTSSQSTLSSPSGPVNSGLGHQFNGPVLLGGVSWQRTAPDPRQVARDHLRWLDQRFVEPTGYQAASSTLTGSGHVLIRGEPGSGRRATAQVLLYRLAGLVPRIRELSDGSDVSESPGTGDETPSLHVNALDKRERLLLDLSRSDRVHLWNRLRELPAFTEAVRDRESVLAVVLPPQLPEDLISELRQTLVDIRRPSLQEVLLRYLRLDDVSVSPALVAAHLPRLPTLAEIVQFSERVKHARDAGAGSPETWLARAEEDLRDRSAEVAERARKLASGEQRALLLASAIYAGARSEVVIRAADALLDAVEHPVGMTPLLDHPNLRSQLDECGAALDPGERVRFRGFGYERAVVAYFWTNYPRMRDHVRSWLTATLADPALDDQDRSRAVDRFAQQALRTARPSDLVALAQSCAQPGRSAQPAVTALECGLRDVRYGAFFRRQLYDWARSSDRATAPKRDLVGVVAYLCRTVLAETYPDQAVVRLHHLYRRPEWRDLVGPDLRELAGADHASFRLLLGRSVHSAVKPQDVDADRVLFLELAGLALRSGFDFGVRDLLVAGWRRVLMARTPSSWREVGHRWLDASTRESDGDRWLDVLVDAGDGDRELLSRLYVLARDWAGESGAVTPHLRGGVRRRLLRKIDEAQGLAPHNATRPR